MTQARGGAEQTAGLAPPFPCRQAGGADNQTDVCRARWGGAGRNGAGESGQGLGRAASGAKPPPRWFFGCRSPRPGGLRSGRELGAMATFVSELEAAKKNLSEALGDNVKQ